MITVKANEFVARQTAESKFSNYEGTIEEVVEMAHYKLNKMDPKEHAPIMKLEVGPQGFKSGVVHVKKAMPLSSELVTRRDGEDPYIDTCAVGAGQKQDAAKVVLIVYSHVALAADATTNADYELVSINAQLTTEEEPLTPVTMSRNFLGRHGGTKSEYTAEEFARSIAYWQDKAMIKED
jgi:hypothetical protein